MRLCPGVTQERIARRGNLHAQRIRARRGTTLRNRMSNREFATRVEEKAVCFFTIGYCVMLEKKRQTLGKSRSIFKKRSRTLIFKDFSNQKSQPERAGSAMRPDRTRAERRSLRRPPHHGGGRQRGTMHTAGLVGGYKNRPEIAANRADPVDRPIERAGWERNTRGQMVSATSPTPAAPIIRRDPKAGEAD